VAQFAPPGATGAGGSAAVNANATYKGYELELTAIPVDRLTVTASIGHIDPEYENFPRALESGAVSAGCVPILASTGVAVGQDCAAIAAFVNFPKNTADFGVNYDFPEQPYGNLSARMDYSRRGHTDWGTFNLPSTPFQQSIAGKAYGLLSARITLSEIPVSANVRGQLALFGANLTDEHYNAQGIDFGFFGTVNYGVRRTIGVEGKLEF
jgi:iron complex outermembrane receptor protein